MCCSFVIKSTVKEWFPCRLLCAVGSPVEGMCSRQSDYGMRTETFTNKSVAGRATGEATEWTKLPQVSKSKGGRESVILETPPSSDCFSFNFAQTKCFRYTVNHRLREGQHFYRRVTYGESTITFLIRRPGDLWMNSLLRGSLKGGLLRSQPQVIDSIPKFAIYFSPFNHLRWQDIFRVIML